MENNIETNPLYKILNPKSVAIFGASNNFTSMGTTQLASLLSIGFEGAIYPIHPREKEVQGLKAYQRVLETPETPELAILVIPTKIVAEVLEECGKKGVKHAIVISGGFNEVGGEGAQLQERLVSVAERYGIRFLGPNCIGVTNPHKKLNTTFHPYVAKPGFIGMASQSGSFITQMFDYLKNFGLGFSAGISVGNEANIDIVDCMNYLADDPYTKVIALYIEGIRRGRGIAQADRGRGCGSVAGTGGEESSFKPPGPFRHGNPSWLFMWGGPRPEGRLAFHIPALWPVLTRSMMVCFGKVG